jgi:hypothetical protein
MYSNNVGLVPMGEEMHIVYTVLRIRNGLKAELYAACLMEPPLCKYAQESE